MALRKTSWCASLHLYIGFYISSSPEGAIHKAIFVLPLKAIATHAFTHVWLLYNVNDKLSSLSYNTFQ